MSRDPSGQRSLWESCGDSAPVEPSAGSPEERLARRLGERLPGRALELVLTENRSTLVSVRERGGRALTVRAHRRFADAPGVVVDALARLVNGDIRDRRSARAVLRRYFGDRPESAPLPRPVRLRTVGRHHDLGPLHRRLDETFFGTSSDVRVTWGSWGRTRRGAGRRTIRLGSYVAASRLVRVHPVLDAPDVPRVVVELVVYHEMLHAVVPARPGRGSRRIVHDAEFRRRERLHPGFAEAEAWLAANLSRLLGRRGGRRRG